MNRILANANDIDARIAEIPGSAETISKGLTLQPGEIVAFKDHVALAQVEGRISLAEAETMQHAITLSGWREGISAGTKAAVYLAAAELLGVDVAAAIKKHQS